MHNAKEELLNVLKQTRELLALRENDFNWSRWDNAGEALIEFDQFVSNIELDCLFDLSRLSTLFAPTAAIQEVSLSSSWGQEFLDVAARFDTALAGYQHEIQI